MDDDGAAALLIPHFSPYTRGKGARERIERKCLLVPPRPVPRPSSSAVESFPPPAQWKDFLLERNREMSSSSEFEAWAPERPGAPRLPSPGGGTAQEPLLGSASPVLPGGHARSPPRERCSTGDAPPRSRSWAGPPPAPGQGLLPLLGRASSRSWAGPPPAPGQGLLPLLGRASSRSWAGTPPAPGQGLLPLLGSHPLAISCVMPRSAQLAVGVGERGCAPGP